LFVGVGEDHETVTAKTALAAMINNPTMM